MGWCEMGQNPPYLLYLRVVFVAERDQDAVTPAFALRFHCLPGYDTHAFALRFHCLRG